jgi:2-polyprenyl-6-methoxyphenol hydroxylase-like FAD-dependent oxidoreductase
VRPIGEHAMVIGGSMAGVLAAGSLAEACERVTIVEHGALPAGHQGRKAVRQGHSRALLPRGPVAPRGSHGESRLRPESDEQRSTR